MRANLLLGLLLALSSALRLVYKDDFPQCTGVVLGFTDFPTGGCQGTLPTPLEQYAHLMDCGGDHEGWGGALGACVPVNASLSFRFTLPTPGHGELSVWRAKSCVGTADSVMSPACMAVPSAAPFSEPPPIAPDVAPIIISEEGSGSMPGSSPVKWADSAILTVYRNSTESTVHPGALEGMPALIRVVVRATLIIVVDDDDNAWKEFRKWEGLGQFRTPGLPYRPLDRSEVEMFVGERVLTLPVNVSDLRMAVHLSEEGGIVLTNYAAGSSSAPQELWTQAYALPVAAQVAIESSITPLTVISPPWKPFYVCYTFQTAVYNGADLTGDGQVNLLDVVTLISAWGTAVHDVTGDGVVNLLDIVQVIEAWTR